MATVRGGLDVFTSIAVGLNSLAASTVGVGRQSAVVDNTTNKYVDAMVQATIVGGASAPSNSKWVEVYVGGSFDGVTLEEALSGADSAYTMDSPSSLRPLGVIPIPAAGATRTKAFDVAGAFSGYLPLKWALVFVNNTGNALAASGHSVGYIGGLPTVV